MKLAYFGRRLDLKWAEGEETYNTIDTNVLSFHGCRISKWNKRAR